MSFRELVERQLPSAVQLIQNFSELGTYVSADRKITGAFVCELAPGENFRRAVVLTHGGQFVVLDVFGVSTQEPFGLPSLGSANRIFLLGENGTGTEADYQRIANGLGNTLSMNGIPFK